MNKLQLASLVETGIRQPVEASGGTRESVVNCFAFHPIKPVFVVGLGTEIVGELSIFLVRLPYYISSISFPFFFALFF